MDKLQIYHRLPYCLKVTAASTWGYYLRSWRYSSLTETLVESALERDFWSPEKWKIYQEEKLAYILHVAATQVPYYREQWSKRRANGDRASWDLLSNWRILTKDEVRKNSVALISDRFRLNTLYQEHTSGTTGSPLTIWCNRSTLINWYALFEARWRRWYGVSFQDRWGIIGGQQVAKPLRNKPPFWVWNQGLNQLYFSSLHLKPDLVHHYVDAMQSHRLIYLFGYSSALYFIAYQMLSEGLHFHAKAVITDSEKLYTHQKKIISEAFECPVYETYGQSELLSAAGVCQYGKMHLWSETSISEVIQTTVQKDAYEENTGNLISTTLMNDVMPMIRYDTSDVIQTPIEAKCECNRNLPVLPEIYGRKDDAIILRDGRRIMLLDIIFGPKMHVKEAQIIQEDYELFIIKVVAGDGWNKWDIEEIKKAIVDRLGQVNVIVEVVPMLERTWRGKARVLISKISNPKQI